MICIHVRADTLDGFLGKITHQSERDLPAFLLKFTIVVEYIFDQTLQTFDDNELNKAFDSFHFASM
jgi:hypothetical protein